MAIATALVTALAVAFQMPIPASATGCPTVSGGTFFPSPPSAGDDLTGCDLTGALLVGVVLTGTNFTNANLTNVDFTGATLTNANFTNANLTNATITGTDFTGANFTGITSGGLTGSPAALPSDFFIVDGNFLGPGANLTGSSLSGASLNGFNLTGTNLTNANLTNANLTGTNLTNANLTNATLTGATLTGASITGATFTPGSVLNTRVGDFRYSYQYDAETDTFEPGLRMVAYTGTSASVTIPGSALNLDVTKIERDPDPLSPPLFANPAAITSVSFANTLTTIGASAFVGTMLTSLTLPTSLISIETAAFQDITTLTGSLSIPNSVTSIGDYAFEGTGFTSLTLGSSVQSIGISAFNRVPIGGSLSIPSSTTSIGAAAFFETSFDGGLTLGSGLTTIGEAAFDSPTHGFIGGLTIPGSVTSIGAYAFRGNEFTTLTIMSGSSEMTIGTSAFAGISTFAGNLTVPSRVVSIGTFAFDSAGFTGTLTLPNSLTTISEGAFNSTGFITVGLGNSVTSIGARAFESVPTTGPLTLPEGLTTVGERAFYNTRITSLSIPSTVTSIGPDAFSSIAELTTPITFPSGLTSLGTAAFYGSGVTGSVVIPSAVTAVPASVFGMTQVSAVTFPSGLTSIGTQAFWRTSIETVTFPSTLTSIGARAFALRLAGSTDITGGTFTFEGPAPTIDATAFEGADGLIVRYPEGASGWPLPSAIFGTASTQTAIPRPPSPSPSTPENPTNTPTNSSQPSSTATQPLVVSQTPLQTPGTAGLQVNGQEIPVTTEIGPRGSGLTLQAGPVAFTLRSQTVAGQRIPVSPDGSLILPRTGQVPISGDGLEPNSSVVITLFSDPIALGSSGVSANGTFTASPAIPSTVPLGAHTLQLSGRTKTGDPFVLSVGVIVETPAAALGANPVITVRPKIITPSVSVSVRAQGVQAGCRVTFTLAGKRAHATASKKGVAQARITMPMKLPRTVSLRASVKGPKCSAVAVSERVPTARSSAR